MFGGLKNSNSHIETERMLKEIGDMKIAVVGRPNPESDC
jgi:hypothetical protein